MTPPVPPPLSSPLSRWQRLRQLWRPLTTSTFRLVLLGAILFALANIALLGAFTWNTTTEIDRSIDRAVSAELGQLQSVYQSGGLGELTGALALRMASLQGRQRIYLLIDPSGVPILGNIAAWPQSDAGPGGRLVFPVPQQFDKGGAQARAAMVELPGCCRLLVGRLQTDRAAFERVIQRSMIAAGLLCLVLGVGIGLLMARHALGRLDAINRIAAVTLKGDLAGRIALSGNGDEFDQLAVNLNAMLERIQRLLAAMRHVTQSIAHELRTPLNRLRNRLEAGLMEAPEQPGEARAVGRTGAAEQTMAAAIKDVDSILATFNALLSIARIEAMAAGQGFAPVDLDRLVTDVAELYGPLAEDEGMALTVASRPGAVVQGNAQLIFQALINLVDNALKHGASGGWVRVAVEEAADAAGTAEVRLVVADGGPGIPAAERKTVLDPFVRLDASHHTPGVGLGLSLVAAVADLHEARLDLADNHPGLKVTLAFPRAAGGQ